MVNGKTCFEEPSINEAYFFKSERYARIKYTPSTNDDTITYGPTAISAEWKTLVQAGFSSIDAAFAIRDKDHANQIYVFSGTSYVRIKFFPGTPDEKILNGPTSIVSGWASLDKAGFKSVDAVLPIMNGGYEGQAYVFKGDQYVRVKVNPGVHRGDTITYGPASIKENWTSLAKVGFKTVDAVLSVSGAKGYENQAYFFYGDEYVRVKVAPGVRGGDEITYGPAKIAENWKSLKSLGW
ncbi:Hemopexin-like domain-containing protein [Apodospora peruviana]|uniref:Hemopexin-like domain-containing protein n=1 Tax=Apodospora peruviana TaxID=516989 RepID=A0AAE0HVF1_9PEZI|nr:Hemopexin-like domain-containing protein [Apodospora peruviana]